MYATKARHLLPGPCDMLVGVEWKEEGGRVIPDLKEPEGRWGPAGRRGVFYNPRQKLVIPMLWPLRRDVWNPSALLPWPGRKVERVTGPGAQGLSLHFPCLSRELPTPWWWEPWPSWTSAWRSCSPSSSPKAPAWPNSGFGCCLFTPLICLPPTPTPTPSPISSSCLCFLLYFFPLLPFLFCFPLFLSLAFSFLLSFQILSFILDLFLSSSLRVPPQLFLPLDCLHMKGFSCSELLSSLRHTNLSQTIASHPAHLFFRPELGCGWGFGILRSLLKGEWKGGRK